MIGRMVRENIDSCMLTSDIPWFLRSFPSLSPHLLGTLWSFFSILNILQLYGLEVLLVVPSCKQKVALCRMFCLLNHPLYYIDVRTMPFSKLLLQNICRLRNKSHLKKNCLDGIFLPTSACGSCPAPFSHAGRRGRGRGGCSSLASLANSKSRRTKRTR
jgi:hypothetical protein